MGLIGLAIATRFLPHPPNFTAVGAAALFGGFIFKKSWKAFLIPVIALFLSDLVLNNLVFAEFYSGFVWFTPGFAFIYGAMLIGVVFGRYFTNGFKIAPLLGAGIGSAVLFYLITNFGAWLGNPLYAQDFGGLMFSYEMGLPFLANQVLGTLCYGGVLFGAAYLVMKPSEKTVEELAG